MVGGDLHPGHSTGSCNAPYLKIRADTDVNLTDFFSLNILHFVHGK